MVDFMERISILDRFSASVCDAVTDSTSSEELLQSIVNRQLLLTPLDEDGYWCRYNPLLAEFLRHRRLCRHSGYSVDGMAGGLPEQSDNCPRERFGNDSRNLVHSPRSVLAKA